MSEQRDFQPLATLGEQRDFQPPATLGEQSDFQPLATLGEQRDFQPPATLGEQSDFDAKFELIKEKVRAFRAKHLQNDTAKMTHVTELKELLPKIESTYSTLMAFLNKCLMDPSSSESEIERSVEENTYNVDKKFTDSLRKLLQDLSPLMCTDSMQMHALCSNLFDQIRTNSFSPDSSHRSPPKEEDRIDGPQAVPE